MSLPQLSGVHRCAHHFILRKQLRVHMASSSVRQEAVSTATGGVTVWLTVLIPLMRQTVVSWRFLRLQLFKMDSKLTWTLPSFPKGEWLQSSPVPGRFRPPYRLHRHLELWILCLHLPVPWIQVPHLPAPASASPHRRHAGFLDSVCNSSGLETPHSCRLCRKILPSPTSQSPATGG